VALDGKRQDRDEAVARLPRSGLFDSWEQRERIDNPQEEFRARSYGYGLARCGKTAALKDEIIQKVINTAVCERPVGLTDE